MNISMTHNVSKIMLFTKSI